MNLLDTHLHEMVCVRLCARLPIGAGWWGKLFGRCSAKVKREDRADYRNSVPKGNEQQGLPTFQPSMGERNRTST